MNLVLMKAHIKEYQRHTKKGKLVVVKEHDDKRKDAEEEKPTGKESGNESTSSDSTNRRRDDVRGSAGKRSAERPDKPKFRVAGQQFVPTPKTHVRSDEYSAASGLTFDANQCLGVNLALDRLIGNKDSGFLLADSTGFGKTLEILAIADKYQKATKKKILIVTQNKQIVETAFKGDAKKAGIDLKNFEIGTYDDLRTGKIGGGEYGLAMYDEAHNLKNQESKKSDAAAVVKSDACLYATATPFDRPSGAAYFLSRIFNDSEESMREKLGFKQLVTVNKYTKEQKISWVLNEGMDWAKVLDNIANMRDEAIKKGAMIRREFPFWGEIKIDSNTLDEADKKEENEIDMYWEEQIDNTESFTMKRNLAGQRILELSRWLESKKIEDVWREVQSALKEKRSLIVVAEGINETAINGLDGKTVPGLIGEIEKRLNKKGIAFAKIYGTRDKAQETEDFQNGKVRIALATPKSGGAGISLDDVVGNNPRKMYIATPNFSGDVFDQILGRVSRRNTKSPSEIEFNVYRNAISDTRRSEIVTKKLNALRSIQNGTDIDVAHFDIMNDAIRTEPQQHSAQSKAAPSQQAKAPDEKNAPKESPIAIPSGTFSPSSHLTWKAATSKAGKAMQVSAPTQEFWTWWKQNKTDPSRRVWVGKDKSGDWTVYRWDNESKLTKSFDLSFQELKMATLILQIPSLIKAHIKGHTSHSKTGKMFVVKEHDDKRSEKTKYQQLLDKKEENWYNALPDGKIFFSEAEAKNAMAKLKKKEPDAEFKVATYRSPTNQIWRVDKKHVAPPDEQRINSDTFVYSDGKVSKLDDTTHLKNDIFTVFKKMPNKTFANASNMNINLYIDTKSPEYYSPNEYSKEFDELRKKISSRSARETALRLSRSGLLSTMADEQQEKKEAFQ